MIVWHDPGHGHIYTDDECRKLGLPKGSSDPGTQHNGLIERDHVLRLAVDIAAGIPWATHYLARGDVEAGPGYDERARMAVEMHAQLVLLHHIDAVDNPKETGLKTFYDPADEIGHEVATAIARAAPAPLYRARDAVFAVAVKDPKHWTSRSWWCLRKYRQFNLPAVLIEWGYSTNRDDVEALTSDRVRPAIVACAAAGIARAFELVHERQVAA